MGNDDDFIFIEEEGFLIPIPISKEINEKWAQVNVIGIQPISSPTGQVFKLKGKKI